MPPKPQPTGNAPSLKRKNPPSSQNDQNNRKKRRVKAQDARVIASQTKGQAFGDGEIDVEKFVKARQFEIKALEDGMKRSKGALTTRAFQNVPRDLRRRTASHNVKRVPKRLRERAKKEMVEDNTPTVTAKKRKRTTKMRLRLETVKKLQRLTSQTQKKQKEKATPMEGIETSTTVNNPVQSGLVEPRAPRIKKNVLQKPPKPRAKFRKRQIFKSWLPTHLFHAKRAHMTPAKEPLWRMAIPISPTLKSYRPTHRASTARGAVAWDMSYMSTIGLEGPEKSIKGVLRALGVKGADIGDCADDVATRWTRGVRSWEGWVHERDSKPTKAIAPVTIIWCAETSVPDEIGVKDAKKTASHRLARKVFMRVHPAGFLQLWEEVLRLGKVQKPAVMVEDLRFEVGSIEMSGPGATEALVGALWPCPIEFENVDSSQKIARKAWTLLRTLTNPASLPKSVVFGFEVTDPRLHHPRKKSSAKPSEAAHEELLQTLAAWPPDKTYGPSRIFDRNARFTGWNRLPSQKAINRRKALATPGEFPQVQPSDPAIPVLLFVTRSAGSNWGSWTVMMPWKCVLPVWYSIMYYPLSSGGTSSFGGLDEKRQIAFESGTPWFPGDYPGTPAGMAWEQQEMEKRKRAWERRPKGKRMEWDSLNLGQDRKGEVGLGWACDWQELLKLNAGGEEKEGAVIQPLYVGAPEASALLSKLKSAEAIDEFSSRSLVTVKLDMVSRGVVTTCARIYRLPTNNPDLRRKWLNLQPSILKKHAAKEAQSRLVLKDVPPHTRRQHLAASLLQAPPAARAGEDDYPVVPDKEDLIGFVTTGNFNLGEGRGTGIGALLMRKLLEDKASSMTENKSANGEEERLCIVREAGQAIGRLARWTFV